MATAGKGTLFVYLQAAFWAACWVLCVGGCPPGLCPWTPLGASCGGLPAPPWGRRAGGCPPPAPPGPLLKKAGENLLENFSGFATDYAGPPLIGSGGLVLFVGS